MGDCPVCGDLVWEDDWRIFDDLIMHPGCVSGYIKNRHGMNENQFLRLCGAQELRQAIQDMRAALKDSMDFYSQGLQSLEEQLAKIENAKQGGQGHE
jgi:polyhydroxyalkanoate synthesis regulator phasin